MQFKRSINQHIVKVQIFRPAKRFFISNHDIGVIDISLCFSILNGIYESIRPAYFLGKYKRPYTGVGLKYALGHRKRENKGREWRFFRRWKIIPSKKNNRMSEMIMVIIWRTRITYFVSVTWYWNFRRDYAIQPSASFAPYRPYIVLCFLSY